MEKLGENTGKKSIGEDFFPSVFGNDNNDQKSPNDSEAPLWKRLLLGTLQIIAIVLFVVVLRTYLVSPFKVDGESMASNFANEDIILVDKMSYRFHAPERGDVVVFYPPVSNNVRQTGVLCLVQKSVFQNESCLTKSHYVKRVIATPGDTVEVKSGEVYVTVAGTKERLLVDDAFLDDRNQGSTCFSSSCQSSKDQRGVVYTVPTDNVYVLGDNRRNSTDSRAWMSAGSAIPFVPYDNIEGKVQAIFWPPTHATAMTETSIVQTATASRAE